jgi:uncharacterized protein (DUF58 family)
MKFSRAARWLLAVMFLIGLAGWAITGLRLYARLVYLCLILVIGAATWTLLAMRGIRLRRRARSLRASMGEVFEERFEVQNVAWPGCTWLEVLNQSELPLAAGSRLLTRIRVRKSRFYEARTPLVRRGAFLLGPTQLTSGDPFGLFTIRKHIPGRDTLIVLPMAFPISTFPPPPGLLPGGRTIRQRSFDVTPHAAGVRDYVPGDPMKRIHWPSTAHRQRFMVKEFEQDPQAEIWLFLDAQREVQDSLPEQPITTLGDGWWLRRPKIELPRNTFEYAVSAAASLADFFLADRRAVGLACAGSMFTVVQAERGTRQVHKLMETLAFLQPEGELPLHGLVEMQAKLLPLGSAAILITSSTRPELLLAIQDLLRRGLRPVIVLIDAETFGGAQDNNQLAASLLNHNVPVCQVACGDDLGAKLSLPAAQFQHFHSTSLNFIA